MHSHAEGRVASAETSCDLGRKDAQDMGILRQRQNPTLKVREQPLLVREAVHAHAGMLGGLHREEGEVTCVLGHEEGQQWIEVIPVRRVQGVGHVGESVQHGRAEG